MRSIINYTLELNTSMALEFYTWFEHYKIKYKYTIILNCNRKFYFIKYSYYNVYIYKYNFFD